MVNEVQKKIAYYVAETYPMYKVTWNKPISEIMPIKYELTITGKDNKYVRLIISPALIADLAQMHEIDICDELKQYIDTEIKLRISD